MDFKKILVRSLSGIIYIGVIVGAILLEYRGITLLSMLFAALASIEFSKITVGLRRDNIATVIVDTAAACLLSLAFFGFPLALWLVCMIVRLVMELYTDRADHLRQLAFSFMTQIYIGVPLALMTGFAEFLGAPRLLLAIFCFIWINDTGAFLVGCTLGKHKLFPSISPKKIWEGFIGGLLLCMAAGVAFGMLWADYFGFRLGLVAWTGLAAVVSVFATWGDLIESMIKRNLSIKDSGNMIPGHGGILDRIDSLLLVMPASFIYVLLIMAL